MQGQGRIAPVLGIINRGLPSPSDGQSIVALVWEIRTPGFLSVAKEEPPAFPILSQLVQQAVGAHAAGVPHIDFPVGLQRFEKIKAGIGQAEGTGGKFTNAFVQPGIHQVRDCTQEDQSAACLPECTKQGEGSAAQRFATRHDDDIVGHVSDLKRCTALRALLRQQGFGDEIEINQPIKQPFCQGLESFIQLLPKLARLGFRPHMQPVALNRMDDADSYKGAAPCQGGIQPCEMILDIGIFPVPGRLIGNGGWIVPLGFAFHGDPGQMRHPYSDAKSGLPVALVLVAPEVEIPVGHAIKLTEVALTACLAGSGLGLLGGSVFPTVAEHVYAGQLEAPVGAHGFSQHVGLAAEGWFLHHMAGEHDIVGLAPCADLVCEGFCKPFGQMVVIVIPDRGDLSVRELPDHFGQAADQRVAIGFGKGFLQVVRPGEDHVAFITWKCQHLLFGKLRLVGEDGRNSPTEFRLKALGVRFMGHVQKTLYGLGVQGIQIGLIIEPGIVASDD